MTERLHPYKNLPDFCFWSRAMTWQAPGQIDPVTSRTTIKQDELIATMGSCFAQNLSRHLWARGFNYFISETAPTDLPEEMARRRNYGVFSARYGNIYTVRQAVQLFDRAFGTFNPQDDVWRRDVGFVDAFRPQIEPEPLQSPEDVRASAYDHLGHVRDLFNRCDWLIFTLGLTETWRSRVDGAVYPIAPGVAGGVFDPDRYEFINFSLDEVRADLALLVDKIGTVNKKAKILLTVSPVPLIATYERRHVLSSTTYSKAVLRVAAEEIEKRHSNVYYFPSYEIITSPASGGRYYKDDLREITEQGIRHVMRVFEKNYLNRTSNEANLSNHTASDKGNFGLVCDEEVIQLALTRSGLAPSQ